MREIRFWSSLLERIGKIIFSRKSRLWLNEIERYLNKYLLSSKRCNWWSQISYLLGSSYVLSYLCGSIFNLPSKDKAKASLAYSTFNLGICLLDYLMDECNLSLSFLEKNISPEKYFEKENGKKILGSKAKVFIKYNDRFF
jgi:hypothetical protein